jgi:hypothetical protein
MSASADCAGVPARLAIHMNPAILGQSGHNGTGARGPKLVRAWHEIPPDVLWRWVVAQVADHSLRGVQQLSGLSKETIRKYVNRVSVPIPSTRKILGELFLRHHPAGVLLESWNASTETAVRPQLIELLPDGEASALATVSALFEAVRDAGGVHPKTADMIERWVELQVRGEYDAERFYARFPSRERKPAERARTSRDAACGEG